MPSGNDPMRLPWLFTDTFRNISDLIRIKSLPDYRKISQKIQDEFPLFGKSMTAQKRARMSATKDICRSPKFLILWSIPVEVLQIHV